VQIGSVQLVIFQHSPLCLQCNSSSSSLMSGFLLEKKKFFGCMWSHSRTTSYTSSSDRKVFPPGAFLCGQKVREALELNLPGRLSCHTDPTWPSFVTQREATSIEQSMRFWSDDRSQMFPKEVAVWGVCDCGLRGLGLLYKWALVIPEWLQRHFSFRCLRAEFFGIWWACIMV
jgi:hypothetical protein